VALFSDEDLETMFRLLDPLGKGLIATQQMRHALDALCVKQTVTGAVGGVILAPDKLYTLDEFKSKMRQALQAS
jgi:hypothetical protein